MAIALPQFPPFSVNNDPTNAHVRWNKWISRFENLIIAMDIKDEKRKRAMLLHYAGDEVDELFATLTDTGSNGTFQSKAKYRYRTIQVSTAHAETRREFGRFPHQTSTVCSEL